MLRSVSIYLGLLRTTQYYLGLSTQYYLGLLRTTQYYSILLRTLKCVTLFDLTGISMFIIITILIMAIVNQFPAAILVKEEEESDVL
jgi:hypothetical protein